MPGAKLREQVVKLEASEPQQFDDFLKARSPKFGELLEEIQQGQDIEVFRKPGTDLYVGYKGASWPSVLPKTKWLLRHDVYEAVTRITDTPFYYIRERDEFTQNPDAKDEVIQLPKVTLDLLMQDRREFAGLQKVSEIKDSLLSAVDSSSNPLADFQRAVADLELNHNWHQFRHARLEQRLETWASHNNVPVSKSWFTSSGRDEHHESPCAILAKFSAYMTDDEAREIHVPFRAVEAMYLALTRKRGH